MSRPDPAPLASLARTLTTVGDRWSLLVVAALLDAPARFGELQERLPAIAPNVLTQRVRALEAAGVVVGTPYSTRPPRYAYELTALGRELAAPLALLAEWGARHGEAPAPGAPRHVACGTPLEVRWWCSTCEQPVALGADSADGELFLA